MWVAPLAWQAEKDDWIAWFSFAQRGESSSYVAADVFGLGQTNYGFFFRVAHGWFGGKLQWNTLAKTLESEAGKLAELGWLHQGKGVFFLAVSLHADLLPSAWELEDWNNALAPLSHALDVLAASQPIFDSIIARAKRPPTVEAVL